MFPSLFHYLIDGNTIVKYDKFCAYHKCQFYEEWECEHGDCFSCRKVGASHNILQYPDDCPMMEDIKLEEELLLKKLMWQKLNE